MHLILQSKEDEQLIGILGKEYKEFLPTVNLNYLKIKKLSRKPTYLCKIRRLSYS